MLQKQVVKSIIVFKTGGITIRKNILLVGISILFTVLIYLFVCMPRNYSDIQAQDGVLDLRGVELSNTIFPLWGTWKVTFNDKDYTTVNILKEGDFFLDSGYGIGDTAVYSLEVLMDNDLPFDFFVPELVDSCEIKVNGEVIFATDGMKNAVVNFIPHNGIAVIEITTTCHIRISNGLRVLPKIAPSPYLHNKTINQRILVGFILGIFFMLGIYHLLLYFHSNKDKIYLVYSMLCIIGVIQLLFETNGLLLWIFPVVKIQLYRVYFLSICLYGVFLFCFTTIAFKLQYNQKEKVSYAVLFIVPSLLSIFMPMEIAGNVIVLGYIPMMLYMVKVTIKKKFKENPYLFMFYLSIILFMLSGIFKIKFERITDTYMMALTYNAFMMFSQCILLSYNYANALLSVERLNENLENQVNERTKELAQTNQQLRVSRNALKEMVGNISHDLKTPVTILGQYLELLDDHTIPLDNQERTDYIHVAYNKNLILQRLISNLFEVTRMETGQLTYQPEWYPVSELAYQLENKYAIYIQNQNLSFRISYNLECKIKIDVDKIWSVFDNIIYNAIRHTPSGGSITVWMQYLDSTCTIGISDTGQGIPKEALPYIFDRFYKVEKSRSETSGDSGIGLYIVKTSVEGMGGFIKVESEIGRGTAFTIGFDARIENS